MIVLTDTTGITVKRRIQDRNHVRIGVTETALWYDGTRRSVRDNHKPHCEFTLNELQDLLNEVPREE